MDNHQEYTLLEQKLLPDVPQEIYEKVSAFLEKKFKEGVPEEEKKSCSTMDD